MKVSVQWIVILTILDLVQKYKQAAPDCDYNYINITLLPFKAATVRVKVFYVTWDTDFVHFGSYLFIFTEESVVSY